MDEIIKKAIEGGYMPNGMGKQGTVNYRYKSILNWYDGEQGTMRYLVLDPLFWQSLQKACDKNGNTDWSDEMEITRFGTHKKVKTAWRYNALKFHGINLTEGWDAAVSWLNNLIK